MLAQNSMKEVKELTEEEFQKIFSTRDGHVFAASVQYLTEKWIDHVSTPLFCDDLDTAIFCVREYAKQYAHRQLKLGRWKHVFSITIHLNDGAGIFYSEHYVPEFATKMILEYSIESLEKNIQFLTDVVLADYKSKLQEKE